MRQPCGSPADSFRRPKKRTPQLAATEKLLPGPLGALFKPSCGPLGTSLGNLLGVRGNGRRHLSFLSASCASEAPLVENRPRASITKENCNKMFSFGLANGYISFLTTVSRASEVPVCGRPGARTGYKRKLQQNVFFRTTRVQTGTSCANGYMCKNPRPAFKSLAAIPRRSPGAVADAPRHSPIPSADTPPRSPDPSADTPCHSPTHLLTRAPYATNRLETHRAVPLTCLQTHNATPQNVSADTPCRCQKKCLETHDAGKKTPLENTPTRLQTHRAVPNLPCRHTLPFQETNLS